jgi:flagellar biosynthesis protein FlhB
MSEQSDLERSEAPTPRRFEQAREDGQLARSRELTTFAVLLAGGGGLSLIGPDVIGRFARLFRNGMQWERAAAYDGELMLARLALFAAEGAIALAPLLVLLAIVAFGAPMLVNGWLFSAKPLAPKFERLNPVNGFKRMFSVASATELAKALAKAGLVSVVAAAVIWHQQDRVLSLASQSLELSLANLAAVLTWSFFAVAGALALIALVDVPFQLWEQTRKLRMTKDEVRREVKETDGDPHVKARIRALQREVARRRMMDEVPRADVVVVNPTRYAVALAYREQGMRAPRVVAKGMHLVAQRIREIAQAHGVPVLEAPPLARALYRHAELGDEIPERLYRAVAEVLAYVYQLRRARERGGPEPHLPGELPVPDELDPEHGSSGA